MFEMCHFHWIVVGAFFWRIVCIYKWNGKPTAFLYNQLEVDFARHDNKSKNFHMFGGIRNSHEKNPECRRHLEAWVALFPLCASPPCRTRTGCRWPSASARTTRWRTGRTRPRRWKWTGPSSTRAPRSTSDRGERSAPGGADPTRMWWKGSKWSPQKN